MSQDNYRSSLPGAARPSAHPRLHALAKPYSRPSSFGGMASSSSLTDLANVSSSLSTAQSPVKSSAVTTRPSSGLPTSSSRGSMTRSGSESSLFGGLKSILSRPLQWLATPGKTGTSSMPGTTAGAGEKRDSLQSFGQDLEDPESPSDRRQGKRLRRVSPSPERPTRRHASSSRHGHGDYEPEPAHEVVGQAVTGFMLPPLQPNVTLKPKSHLAEKSLPSSSSVTNFSRPLGGGGMSSSRSMSYLDPTPDVLSSSPRKGGMLTRSKRVELSSLNTLVDDDDHSATRVGEERGKGRDGENWSPWKSRYATAGGAASSAAVARPTTPGRKTPARLSEQRDFTLPSVSPFKPPASPLAQRHAPAHGEFNGASNSLTRSATTSNIRRAASITSDISMGQSASVRGGIRQSGSMLFGSVYGDRDDDRMSLDGEQRQRDGSVLDWFMSDRWNGRTGSPASLAASRRLGSAGPSLSHAPIRKGQLVWNEDEKAFVRESDLKAAHAPPAVHKSEAERILFTLESMRKTPLADARKGDLPASIGQSSRTIRKTINVPLATAAAGDSAKHRRDRERLGGDDRVSVMISPYGRRKVADQSARDARKKTYENGTDNRVSPTPTASDARSDRSHSQVSDVEMGSQKPSSSVPPTPRRSSRLRKNSHTEEESAPTPKGRRSKRETSKQPESIQEDAQMTPKSKRRTRKNTVERATSPTALPAAPAAVPTITATAPSPGGSGESASTYQPLADGERSRGGSSLRAKSDVSKRTHQGAANYSRSATPSTGRFSAREEDLPDMDELEQANKIPLPSFSGISFAGLSASTAPAASPSTDGQSKESSLQIPAASSAAQPAQSLAAPPAPRRAGGPLARVGHSSTRPRASSPLAGGSIVAEPESPPAAPKVTRPVEPVAAPSNGFFALNGSAPTPVAALAPGSTTPLGKPPASTFFTAAPAATDSDSSKKPFSFGLGKPSAPAAAPVPDADKPTGIPDFFGKKSAPTSGTTTPVAAPAFDFGLPKKTAEEPKAAPAELPAFSFGKPATDASVPSASTSFSFGAPQASAPPKTDAPAAAPSFSFGSSAPKAAETSKPAFSFGSSSTADKPAEPAKSSFSFGAPAEAAAKPTEIAKPAFSFGTATTVAPASEKPADSAKPAFSFGSSSTTAPAPAPTPGFGAGASTPSFSFGKPAEKAAEVKPPAPTNPFGATAPSTTAAAGGTGFTFGAPPASTAASTPFGAPASSTPDAEKSNPFGSTAAPASSSFTFGASASTPAANQANGNAFGSATTPGTAAPSNPFAFGASATAASPAATPASNPFGASTPAVSSSSSPFNFGAPASTAPTPAFGAAPSAAPSNPFGQPATPAAAPSGGFGFSFGAPGGSAAPAPASGGFTFGQPAPAPSTPTTPASTFAFGAPGPSTPSANAAPSFAFGAPASTTPAAAPAPGGFSFGAPAAAAQPPRFGSPAPAPGGDAGGFSLGAADAQPASPGGRRMKALPRRGAVKR
ncbi:hypothetical protein IAU60_005622 [Kwoniella sp. DSM 27419]